MWIQAVDAWTQAHALSLGAITLGLSMVGYQVGQALAKRKKK